MLNQTEIALNTYHEILLTQTLKNTACLLHSEGHCVSVVLGRDTELGSHRTVGKLGRDDQNLMLVLFDEYFDIRKKSCLSHEVKF